MGETGAKATREDRNGSKIQEAPGQHEKKGSTSHHPTLCFQTAPGAFGIPVVIHSMAPRILRRFLLKVVYVLGLVAQVIIPDHIPKEVKEGQGNLVKLYSRLKVK